MCRGVVVLCRRVVVVVGLAVVVRIIRSGVAFVFVVVVGRGLKTFESWWCAL